MNIVRLLRRSISGPERENTVTPNGEGHYDAKSENVRIPDDWSPTDLTAERPPARMAILMRRRKGLIGVKRMLEDCSFTPAGDRRARVLPQSRKAPGDQQPRLG